MTNIYAINIAPLYNEDVYEKSLRYLSLQRLQKINKLKLKDDKLRCAAAGYLLYRALNTYGIDAINAPIHYGEHGKPYLDPPNNNLFFSLSHSGNMALCAISDKYDVGCDIEHNANLKIAQRFFTQNECEILNSSPGPEADFLRLWTLKESIIKLSGQGLSTFLSSFELILYPKAHCLTYPELNFTEFDFSNGYRAAVCTKDEINANVHFLEFE